MHGRILFLLLCLVALAGCAPTLMPTPIVYHEGKADPFAGTHEDQLTTTSQVFIATNRARREEEPQGSTRRYQNARDVNNTTWLARAEVRLGSETMAWEDLLSASRAAKRRTSVPAKVLSIHEYGRLWTTGRADKIDIVRSRVPAFEMHLNDPDPELRTESLAFLRDIDAAIEQSQNKTIYIFVHGFNTNLEGNTILAASLWHYLGRDGVVLSYEWPSRNSLFAYSADKASARVASIGLRLLLLSLNKETIAERIQILAHSAGSPIVVDALRDIRLMVYERSAQEIIDASKVGQVVLAAPDMDVTRFGNAIYDGFDQIPERVTIYYCSDDGALGFSSFVNGFARLGDPTDVLEDLDYEKLRASDTVFMVDTARAIRARPDSLKHSYFHNNPWVNSDLLMLLRYDAAPEHRGLYRTPNGIWEFPTDYEVIAPPYARGLGE